MLRKKKFLLFIVVLLVLLIVPSIVKAAVETQRINYSSDGSIKFKFTGIELDTTHEYQFGIAKTRAEEITKWYDIVEYDEDFATVNVTVQTPAMLKVLQAVDTAYITIKDKTDDTILLEDHGVDVSTPLLEITNFRVVDNGKEFGLGNTQGINIYLRNPYDGTAYFQYEKITDENVIRRYREIEKVNGDFTQLESALKTTIPTAGWTKWRYYNGYGDITGYGFPESPINVPDKGLYYLWIYFSGDGMKPLYGYILVDNLDDEIELDSISLPKTAEVEMGKTLKLTPTFNPANTTNKIVTWISSDETVATVDNSGVVTPIKIGSTIITVTSQDGNKKATCTVTVTQVKADDTTKDTSKEPSNDKTTTVTKTDNDTNKVTDSDKGTNKTTGTDKGTNKTTDPDKTTKTPDTTTANVTLPKTGKTTIMFALICVIVIIGMYTYHKNKEYKRI